MQPQYVVVINTDVHKFVDAVNSMLLRGFALVGGLSVTEADTLVNNEPQVSIVYHQAMIQMPRVAAPHQGLQIPKGIG
jgi:hypothetical protein